MRRMSFALTQAQMQDGTKTVTRRHPKTWGQLKPGDLVQPIAKAQGLKKGEKHDLICPIIEIVSNALEDVGAITAIEVIREGFPGMSVSEFVDLLRSAGSLSTDGIVRRIEFRHIATGYGVDRGAREHHAR